MAASGGERAIDVRGLPPCEPMERILAACDALQPGRSGYVHVIRGSVTVNGNALLGGDALKIVDEDRISLAGAQGAEVLVFDLPY